MISASVPLRWFTVAGTLVAVGLYTVVAEATVTIDPPSTPSVEVTANGNASLKLDGKLDLKTLLSMDPSADDGATPDFKTILQSVEDEGSGGGSGSGDGVHWVPGPAPIDGDVNLDGSVDFSDFQIITANFGTAGGRTDGDLNNDGLVDFADFQILQVYFGDKLIPEPSSWLIWGGLVGLTAIVILVRQGVGWTRKRANPVQAG